MDVVFAASRGYINCGNCVDEVKCNLPHVYGHSNIECIFHSFREEEK